MIKSPATANNAGNPGTQWVSSRTQAEWAFFLRFLNLNPAGVVANKATRMRRQQFKWITACSFAECTLEYFDHGRMEKINE
jgi:hypothetical protein